MGILTDWLTDWLKELLIEGILSHLTGLFDTVNTRVGEIATQVGTTPAAWNAGVFSLIRQLSETVILPIAGLILTFVAIYELIQLIVEKNNLHDLDYWIFFKWIFKTAAAILILSNTFNIVMAVFDVSQSVISRAAGLVQSSTDISASMLDNLLTVNLDNENRYTAFQMVVTMPGMTIDKTVIDELRGTGHQLTVRNLGNGQYLLAGFSVGNSELAGNSGSLLTIATNGQTKGDIVISDIEFATAAAEAYHLAPISISSTATGIYQVEDRKWKQEDVIFDLQGRRVNQPTSGLYIMNGKLIIVK